jgi:hypothetical protein
MCSLLRCWLALPLFGATMAIAATDKRHIVDPVWLPNPSEADAISN